MKTRNSIILFVLIIIFNCCNSNQKNELETTDDIEYRTIFGTVEDENGNPLSSAVIYSRLPGIEKPFGTITDAQGRFTFQIPTSAKQFTVGLSGKSDLEVPLSKEKQYNIILTDNTTQNSKQ